MRPVPDSDLFLRLCRLVARLRAPDGCPWDREQRLENVRAYLLEEAHELASAIDGGDWEEIREELGDLLFQAAFVARLAEEAEAFGPEAAVEGIEAKMVARHAHVFGGEALPDSGSVRRAWGRHKEDGRAGGKSLLDGIAASVPALLAAYRMTQKAADAGFDWPRVRDVLAKVEEELEELRRALPSAGEPDRTAAGPGTSEAGASDPVAEELGDLLFTVANLARHLGVDPEAALARANRKFRRRFVALERRLEAAGRAITATSLAEMDVIWEEVKAAE